MSHEITQIISTYLVPLGIFVAAISYALSQWRSGGSRASVEVIATYREQVQQLKDELLAQATNHTKQINDLTEKVGNLTGLISAKDTQITELKNLLLDKSPEMVEFYKTGNNYFKKAEPILSAIESHLQTHQSNG